MEPNDPNGLAWMARALNLIGKPQEAIDLANRAMRLDPQKPVRYLLIIGLAQFSMGHFEEAATYVEKVLRLNPALVGVNGLRAATYGLLGREQEAQAALDIYKNYLVTLYPFSPNLQYVMYAFPFKDRLVADRFAAGLLKAGLPGKPSGYLHGSKENQLTGKAIRDLLFGSAISGIFPDGQHWTVEIDKEEQITYRGPAVPDTGSKTVIDTGRIRIEGDTGCFHSQKNFLGLEWCWTAFRNANRTSEGKDEYFMMSDIGVFPFSPVR